MNIPSGVQTNKKIIPTVTMMIVLANMATIRIIMKKMKSSSMLASIDKKSPLLRVGYIGWGGESPECLSVQEYTVILLAVLPITRWQPCA